MINDNIVTEDELLTMLQQLRLIESCVRDGRYSELLIASFYAEQMREIIKHILNSREWKK